MGVTLSLCGSMQLMFLVYVELSEALKATLTADRESMEKWQNGNLDSRVTQHFLWVLDAVLSDSYEGPLVSLGKYF